MHILRKHKKGLLIAIILCIGIPMLFFGLPAFWGAGGDMPGTAVVATVGDVPIMESDFRRRLDEVARESGAAERPSNRELLATGAVDDVLNEFVDQALVRQEAQRRNFKVDEPLLIDQIKKDPTFQDESGQFSPEIWNAWVEANENQNMNWNQLYEELNADIERSVYLNQAVAPAARVFDEDIDKELEARYTDLKLKYAKVVVEPTEAQILEEYNTNRDNYRYPDKRRAEYVAISLTPEPTDAVMEAHARAAAGEDFAVLAGQVSDMGIDEQGDMGWVTQPENPSDPVNALFELQPGEVSEPVPTTGGYLIFKNEEERMVTPEESTSPENAPEEADTQEEPAAETTPEDSAAGEEGAEPVREIHGRRILISVTLSPEERQARIDEAQAILDAARDEGGSLESAAGERPIQTTGLFQRGDTEITGLNGNDTVAFINGVSRAAEGEYAEVVRAARNVYVARVTEVIEGEIMPLEEARDDVRTSTINKLKADEEYAAKLEALATEIAEKAGSLEEAQERFPDAGLTVQTTEEFNAQTGLVNGLFVYANEMYRLFAEEEPGTVKGPVQNLLSDTYVVELVSRTPPTDEDKEGWATERQQIRENMMRMAENAYLHDYLLHLRSKLAQGEYAYQRYDGTIARVLGLDQPEEEAVAPPAAGEEAAVTPEAADAPDEPAADAPGAEGTPAEG